MFNDRLDSSGWQHVPTEIAHPWETPVKLRDIASGFIKQVGATDGLVSSALKVGVFLRLDALQELQAHYRYPMPKPGSGQGKNGAIVKKDYCEGLVNYMFPEESESRKKIMVGHLLGYKSTCQHLGKATPHAKDIMAAVQALDASDVPEFEKMIQVIVDEVDLQQARPSRQPRLGGMAYEPRKNWTDPQLRRDLDSLCPRGAMSKIYRHKHLKRYQAFFIPAGQGHLSWFITIVSAFFGMRWIQLD